MVWTPPPSNPIRHIRGESKTLCGRSIGRCYCATADAPVSCVKCAGIAALKSTAVKEGGA